MPPHVSPLAVEKVANLLQSEDDLEKTAQIRAQLAQEKSSVDIQLRLTFQTQIQTTMVGLKTLHKSLSQISEIRSHFAKIGKISQENKEAIEHYELINETSKIYDFFAKVNKVYDHVVSFNDELAEVTRLIDSDLGFHVPDDEQAIEQQIVLDQGTELPNLLRIHYSLNRLRDVRDQFEEYAQTVSNDYRSVIAKLLQPLDYAVKKFDKLLEEISVSLIESCKENDFRLNMLLIKILDIEEREDLKIKCTLTIVDHRVLGLIRRAMEDQGMKYTNASKVDDLSSATETLGKRKLTHGQQQIYDRNFLTIKNQLMQSNAITRLKPRNYFQWFFRVLEQSVAETFRNCHEHYADKAREQPGLYFEILDNLEWVFVDLRMVKTVIEARLVPARWKFSQKLFAMYADHCGRLLKQIIEMEPETEVILKILDYDKKYAAFLKQMGFKKSEISLVIGDDQKERLLHDYKELLVSKMRDWMGNLRRTEEEMFLAREAPPDTDEDGLAGFQGSNVVFKMFMQQAGVAADSGQGLVLAGTIESFCQILINRQGAWASLARGQCELYAQVNSGATDEILPGGLVEYIAALANDQIRGADFLESMKTKYVKMVSKKYASSMSESLDKAIDGFIGLARECLEILVAIMMDDVKEPFSQIFTKKWYDDGGLQMRQVTDTVDEYMVDIQPLLNPMLFEILVELLIDAVLLRYLGGLGNKHVHSNFLSLGNKMTKVIEKIKLDVSVMLDVFGKYYSDLQSKFRVIEYLVDFLYLNGAEEIVEKFKELVLDYNDVPMALMERILRVKKVSSKEADTILDQCNNAKNEYLSQLGDPVVSFLEGLTFK